MQKGYSHIDMLTVIPLVTLIGPTLCYSKGQVVSACQSFRPVAPFFFLALLTLLAFLYIKRCGHDHDVLMVTLILNIYGFRV